ncbi:UspA domain protein [Methanosalsum zhilinae DSM 4017]|uniref:UspA domain protein n=1 Tax=Methanosalsum zhilinae (strain DSM 4017 / NBRC 107636 / OCM 62 / WeN5) TaxID=679901 RepID=F7XN93_METZD|nr:universal stress protein [Methanosalsum zhilinae]AEH60051.1 UspA domain protein [Methanosalsum zhilinae DSM 4017]
MIRTILFPVDFSTESSDVLSCAGELKNVGLEKVILLHVVDIYKAQGLAPMFERNAKEKIEEYRKVLEEMDIDSSTLVVQGDVKKTIASVAEDEGVDCIIMGATTGGFIRGRLMGRTTEYISRTSSKMVLIEKYDHFREEDELYIKACSAKFSRVLLPMDFSRNSKKALDEIEHLSDIIHELILMHVIERARSPEELEEIKEDALKSLRDLGQRFEDKLDVEYQVAEGNPSESIDRFAEETDVTLIAVTTHGKGSFKDILLGSTAENLLRRTLKPVLLIPAGKR